MTLPPARGATPRVARPSRRKIKSKSASESAELDDSTTLSLWEQDWSFRSSPPELPPRLPSRAMQPAYPSPDRRISDADAVPTPHAFSHAWLHALNVGLSPRYGHGYHHRDACPDAWSQTHTAHPPPSTHRSLHGVLVRAPLLDLEEHAEWRSPRVVKTVFKSHEEWAHQPVTSKGPDLRQSYDLEELLEAANAPPPFCLLARHIPPEDAKHVGALPSR